VDQAQRPPFGPRPRQIDPHLDHELERGSQAIVWHKSADEILDSLASYCQRISDSGH
jgi:hypothetical protein